VTNTGRRSGTATAQIYLGLPARTGEPPKRLVGFTHVTLAPGESRVVEVKVDGRSASHPLSYYDEATQSWVTSPGAYRVYVGASARNTPLQSTIHIG
jgi:beta-glucosidase